MSEQINLHLNPGNLEIVTVNREKRVDIICFDLVNKEEKKELKINIGQESEILVLVMARLEKSTLTLETSQNHIAKNGQSDLYCRTLVGEVSHFKYFGKVVIEKEGNESHAYQRNENLLLSEEATTLSEPTLEIKANEVFCTHGATISSLDEEELYYLISRGLAREKAERLLTKGFLLSPLEKLFTRSFNSSKIQEMLNSAQEFYRYNHE